MKRWHSNKSKQRDKEATMTVIKRPWTYAEHHKVLTEYGPKSARQLATELGRTTEGIRTYVKRLNAERKCGINYTEMETQNDAA
jgi:ATP-dependent RNA circularization protein (DNA/RNA ligase family)